MLFCCHAHVKSRQYVKWACVTIRYPRISWWIVILHIKMATKLKYPTTVGQIQWATHQTLFTKPHMKSLSSRLSLLSPENSCTAVRHAECKPKDAVRVMEFIFTPPDRYSSNWIIPVIRCGNG